MTSRWAASRALAFRAGDIGVGGSLSLISPSVDGPVTILASRNNHPIIMWCIKERQFQPTIFVQSQDQVLHYVAAVFELGLSYGRHHLLSLLAFDILELFAFVAFPFLLLRNLACAGPMGIVCVSAACLEL